MCLLCTKWAKGSMTVLEAQRNLFEMVTTTPIDDTETLEHIEEIAQKIFEEGDDSYDYY